MLITNMKTKTCKTCNETKDITAFKKRSGHCIPCLNNINRKLYFLKKGKDWLITVSIKGKNWLSKV